jgi:hypothetical protein
MQHADRHRLPNKDAETAELALAVGLSACSQNALQATGQWTGAADPITFHTQSD